MDFFLSDVKISNVPSSPRSSRGENGRTVWSFVVRGCRKGDGSLSVRINLNINPGVGLICPLR